MISTVRWQYGQSATFAPERSGTTRRVPLQRLRSVDGRKSKLTIGDNIRSRTSTAVDAAALHPESRASARCLLILPTTEKPGSRAGRDDRSRDAHRSVGRAWRQLVP